MKRLIVLATALTFLTGTYAFPQAGSQTSSTQTEKKEEKKKETKKKEEKKKGEKK
jgi:ribosomal protein L12E/L44/L45/RPP1/RPP2